MIKKYLTFLVFTFSLSVIFNSYVTEASPQKKEESPYVANFTYTPDSQAAPGFGGVTFLVENIVFNYRQH